MNAPDLVILVAAMGLNLALLPTLFSRRQPPFLTSVGFSACVLAIGGALLSMSLWLGGGANLVGGVEWLAVAGRGVYVRRS